MTSLLKLKSMLITNALKKSKKKKKHKISKPMSSKKIINTIMCRICNLENGCISIFDNSSIPNIPEEIHHFSGVIIEKSDSYSKHMCQSCLDLLNGCIVFRDICQKNNQKMMEFAVQVKKEEITDIDRSEDKPQHKQEERDSDDSYNIPSPEFSDENYGDVISETCRATFYHMTAYGSHKCNNRTCKPEPKPPEPKRKFLCDICGKTAYSNASLLVHMGTHENVFPFKCDTCPYQGRTMDLLKVHKRSHLADKPYKCTQCPKATTTSSNLSKHMRHVHSNTRPYKCNYCDKAFSFQHDVNRHVKDTHLRQGTVECDVCYKKFNTKKILQGHQRKIHKIKGERLGRLPSYLQCQTGEQSDNHINESDPGYD